MRVTGHSTHWKSDMNAFQAVNVLTTRLVRVLQHPSGGFRLFFSHDQKPEDLGMSQTASKLALLISVNARGCVCSLFCFEGLESGGIM